MTARRSVSPLKRERMKFEGATLEQLASDLTSGRTPLDRLTVTDERELGLRAVIRNTGLISFHVQYDFDGARPWLKLGSYPDMSINQARAIARTVKHLADKGIDVQAGLHERLIRELQEKGEKWKP